MTVMPWDADRALDAGRVRQLIEEHFPELVPASVRFHASGWDHDVFCVNDEWFFRFPRRTEINPWFERELRVLPLIARALSIGVPVPAFVAAATAAFPYPFAGYRPVLGTPGHLLPDSLSAADEMEIAGHIGRALRYLHQMDLGEARMAGAQETTFIPGGRTSRAYDASLLLRRVLPAEVVRAWELAVSNVAALGISQSAHVLVHGDLVAEHLIFEATSLELVGMIDFADVQITDPAKDFVGLYHWRGEAFVCHVLAAYGEHDPELIDRVRRDVAVAGGYWLADALEIGDDEDTVIQRSRFERWVLPLLL